MYQFPADQRAQRQRSQPPVGESICSSFFAGFFRTHLDSENLHNKTFNFAYCENNSLEINVRLLLFKLGFTL